MAGRLDDLDVNAILSLQHYVRQRTVPLLLRRGDGECELLGTGTLAELSGRKFIITARHCVNGRPLQNLIVPEKPADVAVLKPVQGVVVSAPATDEIDVAIIDVSETWMSIQLSDGWQFVKDADVGNYTASDAFLIVGFPEELMRRVSDGVAGPPVMIITGMIAGAPASAENVQPGLDRFFRYARESRVLGGGDAPSLDLHGVSGAAVWQYTPQPDVAFWSPGKCLQMLAVEHACKHDEYVRAHDWRMVTMIVEKVVAGLVEVRSPDQPS